MDLIKLKDLNTFTKSLEQVQIIIQVQREIIQVFIHDFFNFFVGWYIQKPVLFGGICPYREQFFELSNAFVPIQLVGDKNMQTFIVWRYIFRRYGYW